MPRVLRHPDVVLELIVEGRAGALLDLRVQDAVHAAVVALLAVEVAVDRLGEQRVDDLVLVLLRDQDVDVDLGPEAGDPLHQLERGHLQPPRVLAVEVVELVVDHDRLHVAVLFQGLERLARGGDAGEGEAERVVERAGGGVEAFYELAQYQRLVVDDEHAADGLAPSGGPRGG